MMNEREVIKMIDGILKGANPKDVMEGLNGIEKDLMFTMVSEIMDELGTNKLNILVELEKEDITKVKKAMSTKVGILDLDGLKKELESKSIEVKEQARQINTLKKELERRKESDIRKGKRLEEKKHEIDALKKQVELLKNQVPRVTLNSGDVIAFEQDYLYGSIQELGLSSELTKLWENGFIVIQDNNYIIPNSTVCEIGTDKHGYDLIFKLGEEEISLQCALLDEEISEGIASIKHI